MPKGFGVGLRVATIPVAGVEPLSDHQTPGDPGSPPGGGGSSGGASGGIGGVGLIVLLLLALGIGVPALVTSDDDEQAQVQQSGADMTNTANRVKLGTFQAE